MNDLKTRKRSVDVDKLSAEQAEAIAIEIGKKMATICDEAVAKANDILKIYGLETRMQFQQPFPKDSHGGPK